MTTPSAAVATLVFTLVNLFIYVQALGGSATTLAVVYGSSATICGIIANQPIQTIQCWKDNQSIPTPISPNVSFDFIAGGFDGFTAVRSGGFSLLFWNTSFVPKRLYFSNSNVLTSVTMGGDKICGIMKSTKNVTCWRGDLSEPSNGSSQFLSISSGSEFSCGVLESSNRVVCWGNSAIASTIQSEFRNERMMNIYAGGRHACGMNATGFFICRGDNKNGQLDVPSHLSYEYFGFALGINHTCGIRRKKVHNSVQPTITATSNGGQLSSSGPISRSSTLRRQGSRLMRRQRSGTSSKHADRAEEFLFTDLAAATNNFSLENKIGAGSFGVVYKGKLPDGRELELVGYCEERDERLLVYEYMKNGALFDHLHDKNNVEKTSSIVNSWKMRIKIALDAARGIEYLHNYAVPPIIHRDIKSSNILIDGNWIARVSDFGLSLMGDHSSRPMKAAGTVGYIDPEYYGLNVLTAKSDVYGLGVVLLELLTGKRAIFKSEENGGAPMSVVDYGVAGIMAGELNKILDKRVGTAEASEEVEAVELVAYTAMHCVHLEGKDRPTISDIVSNLERALAAFDDSHGSISSGPISFVSD
uniref:non-specific serine/threonine protein kinase n=1 Tax=Solanum lycopersicum TaxID=4081 RepID=Q5GA68_SOLLC|nr:putative protein kinase [Solanum lycopersicum]